MNTTDSHPTRPAASGVKTPLTYREGLTALRGELFMAASWLVGRHPVLHRLARRVPGAVDGVGDVLPWVLADAFTELDDHIRAWTRYENDHPAPNAWTPEGEAAYERWVDAGPRPSDRAAALEPMSRTEIGRLRLVATLSSTPVPFSVEQLVGLDDAGRDLVSDWMTAVAAYLDLPDRCDPPTTTTGSLSTTGTTGTAGGMR